MKSLQHVVHRDQELHPSESKPFLTYSITDGDELHVREDRVALILKLPGERTLTLRDVMLTDRVSRIKFRSVWCVRRVVTPQGRGHVRAAVLPAAHPSLGRLGPSRRRDAVRLRRGAWRRAHRPPVAVMGR